MVFIPFLSTTIQAKELSNTAWCREIQQHTFSTLLKIKNILEMQSFETEKKQFFRDQIIHCINEKINMSYSTREKDGKIDIGGEKKYVALTFDDGPGKPTQEILDALESYHAKATFFVVGKQVEKYPEMVSQMTHQEHEIGNHSWNHYNMKYLTRPIFKRELSSTDDEIVKAGGFPTICMRPPYGSLTREQQIKLKKRIIYRTVDTRDRESRNAQAILQKVKKYTKNGSIILLHDIHQTTADAVIPILQYLTEQGYTFVTVSQLLKKEYPNGIPHIIRN